MATLTHAQYNSPLPLYSRDNVQDVLNHVTSYPGRPHSAMSSGSFDPNQSHVYRYLQTSGQLPTAHSARYDDQAGVDHPRYRGFVDPNVQSPSFKRLQYVTGVDSGVEDEISQEVHPPPQARTEDIQYTSRQTTTSQQSQGQSQSQPIALGYAPIGSASQQQYTQQSYQYQQPYDQQQQYQQEQYDQSSTRYADLGPLVAQRDPAAEDTERDHPLEPNFAAKIAEAERPKVPPPVVPGWARYAERKHERWEHRGQAGPQQSRTVQYYRPPQPTQHINPQWTLDSSRAAQDKWQAHYAPYRFETGATPVSHERPRSKSVEPAYVPGRRYGGHKEWMKPYIAPTLRFNYGENFAPPAQLSYSPLSTGRTYVSTTNTTQQGYDQYGSQLGGKYTAQTGSQYGAQGGSGTSAHGVLPYGTHACSSLSSSGQHQSQYGTGYALGPGQQQGGKSVSTCDYTSTSTSSQGGQNQAYAGTATGASAKAALPVSAGQTGQSQYSRTTTYDSRKQASGSSYQQRQPRSTGASSATSYGTDAVAQASFEIEREARRQRQVMEEEVRRRAASAGPASGRQVTSSTVSQYPHPQETRVSTYTTTPGGQQRWQQAPGSETKTQSSGSYIDAQGNVVNYTKEVFTSSDPGKEFSMLTEQEKKILEEPLQPGVISRHITTKYYKKSTFTSSTTTSTSQTPPVTSSVTRQAITGGPGGRQF